MNDRLLSLIAFVGLFNGGLFGFLSAVHAQAPSKTPAFEVASIRRCYKLGGPEAVSAGYLEQPCQPLIDLIRSAYIYYEGGRFHPGHIA